MQQAWDNVNTLMKDIAPFLKRANLAESQYNMPIGDITQIKIDKYNEVFDFLDDLLKTEQWERVQNAWALCTPERWQFYDDHEMTGLQEQQILDFACFHLGKLWRETKPTGFFGRNEKAPDEDTDY